MAVSQGGASAAIYRRDQEADTQQAVAHSFLRLKETRSVRRLPTGRLDTPVSPPTSRSMPCLPNRLRLEAIATHVRRSSARLHSTRRVEVTDHVAQFVKMNR